MSSMIDHRFVFIYIIQNFDSDYDYETLTDDYDSDSKHNWFVKNDLWDCNDNDTVILLPLLLIMLRMMMIWFMMMIRFQMLSCAVKT